MEPDKVANYYTIQQAYKGRISKKFFENEAYRQNKVYSLWIEFGEKFDMIWQTLTNTISAFFCPTRAIKLTCGMLKLNDLALLPNLHLFKFIIF